MQSDVCNNNLLLLPLCNHCVKVQIKYRVQIFRKTIDLSQLSYFKDDNENLKRFSFLNALHSIITAIVITNLHRANAT